MPQEDAYNKVEAEFKVVEDKVRAQTCACVAIRSPVSSCAVPRDASDTALAGLQSTGCLAKPPNVCFGTDQGGAEEGAAGANPAEQGDGS